MVSNKNTEVQELGIVFMAYLFLWSGQTQTYSVFSYLMIATLWCLEWPTRIFLPSHPSSSNVACSKWHHLFFLHSGKAPELECIVPSIPSLNQLVHYAVIRLISMWLFRLWCIWGFIFILVLLFLQAHWPVNLCFSLPLFLLLYDF